MPALTTGCPVVMCGCCGSTECRTVGFDQLYVKGDSCVLCVFDKAQSRLARLKCDLERYAA